MYFQSVSFIVFLVIVFLGYYTLFRRRQWQFLLAASFVFYAFSGLPNLIFISATVITTYLISLKMSKLQQEGGRHEKAFKDKLSKEEMREYKAGVKAGRRRWLILCLVINFGILAVVKYADFMLININAVAGFFAGSMPFGRLNFVLPLGISFYTFQIMSYIIDLYRGRFSAERNIFKLALFTSFFPQLIQGPISRFDDLKGELFSRHSFEESLFSQGVLRILLGFFKKMVIADRLLIPVKALTENQANYQGIYYILAVSLYAVTLYCDFTGGIDITIGIGRALGIKIKENFNMPFYSKNIADYWRRWHITMGTWFKDYIFFPLSVSKPMLNMMKRAKKVFGDKFGKRTPVYAATIVTWLATGLWHGAAWNFVVWGLVNGVIIILSQELTPAYSAFHKRFGLKGKKIYEAFQVFRTFWLMCFIRSFDIYGGVGNTVKMFLSMFTNLNIVSFFQNGILPPGLSFADYAVAGVGVVFLIVLGISRRWLGEEKAGKLMSSGLKYPAFIAVFLLIAVFGIYGIGYDANQFIYNRF